MDESSMSEYKEAIIGYIGGYIVRKMLKSISCSVCAAALIENNDTRGHYLSLTSLKDNGGLIFPSVDVFKVIKVCELIFKGFSGLDPTAPQISGVKNIKGILCAKVMRELPCSLFETLQNHNNENEFLNEDLHVTQVTKEIVSQYLNLRLLRYGQHYSEMVLNKN